MKAHVLLGIYLFIGSYVYPQWMEFHVQTGESVWASSILSETYGGKLYNYGPEYLFDNDLTTAWVEGDPGNGTGEQLTVLTNRAIQKISLNNGFSRSPSLYQKNNRIRNMDLSFLIGFTAPGMVSENDYYLYLLKEFTVLSDKTVEDSSESQSFDIPFSSEEQLELYREVFQTFIEEHPFFLEMMLEETGMDEEEILSDMNLLLIVEVYGFFAMRITIKDVYKGSLYNDCCLSELSLQLEEF